MKFKKIILTTALLVSAFTLSGCGESDEEKIERLTMENQLLELQERNRILTMRNLPGQDQKEEEKYESAPNPAQPTAPEVQPQVPQTQPVVIQQDSGIGDMLLSGAAGYAIGSMMSNSSKSYPSSNSNNYHYNSVSKPVSSSKPTYTYDKSKYTTPTKNSFNSKDSLTSNSSRSAWTSSPKSTTTSINNSARSSWNSTPKASTSSSGSRSSWSSSSSSRSSFSSGSSRSSFSGGRRR